MSANDRYNDKMSPVRGGPSAAMRAYAKLGSDVERNIQVQDVALIVCSGTTVTARSARLKLCILVYGLNDAEVAFLRHFI